MIFYLLLVCHISSPRMYKVENDLSGDAAVCLLSHGIQRLQVIEFNIVSINNCSQVNDFEFRKKGAFLNDVQCL
jgi:hypothetical protein